MQKFIVWACFIISLLWVGIHQRLLLIPATSEARYNLGMLFQAIALSYIAAFLFYLVHNVYPERKFKKKMKPVVNEELTQLWYVCNAFTYSMRFHSGTPVIEGSSANRKDLVSKQIANLPVFPGVSQKDGDDIPEDSIRILPDHENKPIVLQSSNFDYWSDATQYFINRTEKTLSLLLSLKEFVDVETLIKISLLKNTLGNFKFIADTYENQRVQRKFDNLFTQKDMIHVYEAYEYLKTIKEEHEKYIRKQRNIK
ncbi:hypothetical protein [Bacillus cereus]|uniref:hypothetical protein n=1 Tax=Bacillus cereus TaxID=1396 RepID=UPI000BFD1554|nr:hypothetical protein [Bacillus cereus]PGU49507.1 hypothetical protein COD72_30010 [Bacillus cereus]